MHEAVKPGRALPAIALGAATWWLFLKSCMFILKAAWPEYAAAYPERAFTLPMYFVRLVIFAATTGATAAVATRVAPARWMPWLAGGAMLLLSIPDHLYPGYVWETYPVWYHLTYLAYLVPVALIAGRRVLGHSGAAPIDRSPAST